jgi:cobaltochelatase CobN
MHLLAATPGETGDGTEAVDLGQTPGDIVFLSAADSELALLAEAKRRRPDGPSLRLANLLQLGHPMSVDLYAEEVAQHARLLVVRLLGGQGYWPYGVEQLRGLARERGQLLALLPGDDKPDAQLAADSTVPAEAYDRIWRYLIEGGPDNAAGFLGYAADLLGAGADWSEPAPLLRAGLYWPGLVAPDLEAVRGRWADPAAPVAAISFYRALVQSGDLAPVDALVEALQARGLNPLPLYAQSLKDPVCAETVRHLLGEAGAGLVLNCTGFALSAPGAERAGTPFDGVPGPVLQVVLSGSSEARWRDSTSGLAARDIAMNVALPEVDGRLLSRAVSFKTEARRDAATQCPVVRHKPVPDRVAFVAELARSWSGLAATPAGERKVALVLANYPNRDGRLGNGVGLDTPAATHTVLQALADAGYDLAGVPEDGQALIRRLQAGPTNAAKGARTGGEALSLADYREFFAALPEPVRDRVTAAWGAPEDDPFVVDGAFRLALHRFGNVWVGVQPARGYNIDPVATYHSPDLVPPHGYLAFYAWLRQVAGIQAVVHMGKHGNLEWLPGKALALSEDCFPEAVFGPLPHLYPFIVNDPGEGTQAKRRAQAVVLDHLTPPLTRAETYGPLADLEALVDEYYEAAGVDPRRLEVLRGQILDATRSLGLDRDCGIAADEPDDSALAKLDNHLCELKELQIRDGLHVFGRAPSGRPLSDLLVALVRLPRGEGQGAGASLHRALAADLGLEDMDPLTCALGEPYAGPKPAALADMSEGTWRTNGDTVERLELLAQALVEGRGPEPRWTQTAAVLDHLKSELRPLVEGCGAAELAGLLRGLAGKFVEPGPSGAPTRGRPEVLPTGRNFYSVDTRVVPTPAAWQLGWKSANLLLERHRQEEGTWPTTVALSAWGTANMRTGGDDLAQAFALMGVRPTWDAASRRVTGYEVLPLSLLDRPRVDVTLRVSGFFRDAFPAQMELFDAAVRQVAGLDEPPAFNPLAAKAQAEIAELTAAGLDEATARRRATFRVFGSKPGAYGAGLQALIDERGWTSSADLAAAYMAWGSYAYGAGAEGQAEGETFRRRLSGVEAVLHNQDNREHDLLDSDDYYQFEGGLHAAVEAARGAAPTVYHNDHSRPERPVIRTLGEEIGRIVRGRAANPKWIAGVMRHGYKGAFEIAATVDYLFAFAATTHAVSDQHFEALYEAYLDEGEVQAFLAEANPAALAELSARFKEAIDRGLWRPRANAAYHRLDELSGGEAR